MKTRIVFVCPKVDNPTGGVQVIFEHAQILRAAGQNAVVSMVGVGAEPKWFNFDVPLTSHMDLRPDTGDLLVIPEVFGDAIGEISKSSRYVIFNQNAHFSFDWISIENLTPGNRSNPYRNELCLGAVVVSEDNKQYLAHAMPGVDVQRVRNGFDATDQVDLADRKFDLSYMPRKNPDHADRVLKILQSRGVLPRCSVAVIDQVSHEQSVDLLRQSRLFMSFGYPEGLPLPILESLGSGCIVVGYHGNGAREILSDEVGFPIEFGDVVAFARRVELVLRDLEVGSGYLNELSIRARQAIATYYSKADQEHDALRVWEYFSSKLERSVSDAATADDGHGKQ